MWLVPAIFAVLALFLAGCMNARVICPGNGKLVVVEIDPALDACALQLDGGGTATIGAAVRAGIRYWDAAGARLRTIDQLLPSETEEAARAMRLRVWGDSCATKGDAVVYSGTSTWIPSPAAQYRMESGDIQLFLSHWAVNRNVSPQMWLSVVCTLAHETGHAIGLDHVPEKDAIMNADAPAVRVDLSAADLREHARVWP